MMTLLLLSAILQTPAPTAVKPDTPFLIEWYQPDAVASQPQFRWSCNGAIVKNFRTGEALAQGDPDATGGITYRAQVPGLPLGTHPCHVTAFNAFGEASGEETSVPVGVAPSKPSKVTIIQITVVSGG